MHTAVWNYYNGKIDKKYHIHHKDKNPWNNRIENLELVGKNKHLSEHGKRRFKENKEWAKEFHKKGVEEAKKWHKSKEGREWHKEHGKKTWKNRKYKTLICEVCGKEYKTRHGWISKYCHQNCKAKALRKRRRDEKRSI
ncbi:MAG: HNH endonuclease [Nanobdellota archaeon]